MRKVGDWTPGTQSWVALRLYGFYFLHTSWARETWMLLLWLSHASPGTLHPSRVWLDNIEQNPWELPRWRARPNQPRNSNLKTKKHEELTLPIVMLSPAHSAHNQSPHSTISTTGVLTTELVLTAKTLQELSSLPLIWPTPIPTAPPPQTSAGLEAILRPGLSP